MKHHYSLTRLTLVSTVVFIMGAIILGGVMSNYNGKKIEEERLQRNREQHVGNNISDI